MSSSLLQLGDTIWGGTDKIISFLRRNGLLASAKNCSRLAVFVRSDLYIIYYRCRVPMQECVRSDVSDGVSWYCPQCYTRKSIRDGSFFSKSKITFGSVSAQLLMR